MVENRTITPRFGLDALVKIVYFTMSCAKEALIRKEVRKDEWQGILGVGRAIRAEWSQSSFGESESLAKACNDRQTFK